MVVAGGWACIVAATYLYLVSQDSPTPFRHAFAARVVFFVGLVLFCAAQGRRVDKVREIMRRYGYEGNRAFRVLASLVLARLVYYLSVDLRRAAGAMVVAVVLVAAAVTWVSSTRTPTYEASAQVWVDQVQGDQQTYLTRSGEEIQTLPPSGEGLQAFILTMIHAIDSPPIAKETIERLGLKMSPAQLLDNLTIEQVESTGFIVLTYQGTDPVRAKYIVNIFGKVSSELISERGAAGSRITATLYEPAVTPESRIGPHPLRNGVFVLAFGWLFGGGFLLTLSGCTTSFSRRLSERIRVSPLSKAGNRAVPTLDAREAERIKEKELLRALGRCGKLSATGAALATSLSVDECDRMLQALTAEGHIEVIVEHGRLVYGLWGHGA